MMVYRRDERLLLRSSLHAIRDAPAAFSEACYFHACSICTSSSGYFGRHPSDSTARVGSATNCGGSPGLRATTSAAIRRPVTRLAASSTFLTDAPPPVPRLNLSDAPRSSRKDRKSVV